jgi:hypothetical protein
MTLEPSGCSPLESFDNRLWDKFDWRHAFFILFMMILALGAHTPLFRVLFDWLPGFDKFRGTSKFMFFASLFWILLAGYGLDRLIRQEFTSWKLYTIPLAVSLILGGAAVWIFHTSSGTTTHSLWALAGCGDDLPPGRRCGRAGTLQGGAAPLREGARPATCLCGSPQQHRHCLCPDGKPRSGADPLSGGDQDPP